MSQGNMSPGDMSQVMPTASAASRAEVEWTLPKGWKQLPPSEMRLASFSVEGKEGLKADISIVVLGGISGGELANVNRWRGQLNLEPIGESDLSRNTEMISPGGRHMLMVDIVSNGPFIDNRYKKRLVAVMHTRGEKIWFFKMTGEDALIRSVKPSFLRLLESLRFHDTPPHG